MPRSSRCESSKHNSREGRGYSDTEKDTSLKDRRSKEESVAHGVSKKSASGEKRKYTSKTVDGKDLAGAGNVVFIEEFVGSSSKRRKEKVDDDRWTGGDTVELETLNSEAGAFGGDEGKRSGGKRSAKDGAFERDRKGKEYSTSNRIIDGETGTDSGGGEGNGKHVLLLEEHSGKYISSNPALEKRLRKKYNSNDVDRYVDGREVGDGRLSSRDEIVKPEKKKDDGCETDRYKDKYGKNVEKDSRLQNEKQQHRDGCHARDYANSRPAEKYMRNERKDLDVHQNKSKPQDSDRDHGCSHYIRHYDDHDRDDKNRDIDCYRDGERVSDRDRGQYLDHDRGRDQDRDPGCDHDRDRGRGRGRDCYHHERERDRKRERDPGRERDHDHDYATYPNDKRSRYKEDRSRRSPGDSDDNYKDKARSARADAHADRGKSASYRAHSEAFGGSTGGRTSPSSTSLINMDKHRYGGSREMLVTPDKSSKHTMSDKGAKSDDNHVRGPSAERSPWMKTSSVEQLEKSPSSTSIDRIYTNRSSIRPSVDIDEGERSSGSNDVRDGSTNDDRQRNDSSFRKSIGEVHSPVESSFHHKSSHDSGPFLGHGPSSHKAGADSPSLIGSMGEDSGGHNSHYRSVDPNPGRTHGDLWKGVPNWPIPLQTSFMPFPPAPRGPPHGRFPSMLAQFSQPSFFGVRPPMNHVGVPYHLPDADRFSKHMRFLGWKNVVDGIGSSPFHVWNGNNGYFREETTLYGAGTMSNGTVMEENADVLKPNGDVYLETAAEKVVHATKNFRDEACVTQGDQASHTESLQQEDQGKFSSKKAPGGTPIKGNLPATTTVVAEKDPAIHDGANISQPYLSELDISLELTHPELYNKFLSLVAIEQSETFEEMEDVNFVMRKAVDSEITIATVGISLFPAVEDSIFQKAIALYKTHNTDRKYIGIFCGNESCGPAAPEMKIIEQAQGRDDKQVSGDEMDEPILYQEGLPVEELSSATGQTEQMESEIPNISSGKDVLNPSENCEMEMKECWSGI